MRGETLRTGALLVVFVVVFLALVDFVVLDFVFPVFCAGPLTVAVAAFEVGFAAELTDLG